MPTSDDGWPTAPRSTASIRMQRARGDAGFFIWSFNVILQLRSPSGLKPDLQRCAAYGRSWHRTDLPTGHDNVCSTG